MSKNKKPEKPPTVRKALKQSRTPGVNDALCTECRVWYDSSNTSEVNKHAH